MVGVLAMSVTAQAETPRQRDARMEWWREARFGMFVHWGLYSGMAGTWEGKPVGTRGGMEWIQQRVKADTDSYAKAAIPKFKPTPGFAREWAKLAKEAGCKYLVFTTKHHDGFALHDSKVSDYDAGDVLQRDLVKEIVAACRAEGLKVGFYHSVIDWHHDQYAYEKSKQLPHPLKGKPYPNGERDHSKYVDYLHKQVNELVSSYGNVDVLWWDYSSQDFQGDEAWRAFDLMKLVRAKQPKIIMNNRLFRSAEAGWKSMGTEGYAATLDPKYGDFITPEQHIPATGMPGVDWETCMTLNTTWGYSEHDHAWKSDETLIRNLIDIASKGGNYLLNIGPKGDGSLTKETVRSFRAIGAWMKTNGEAIYGTSASPFEKLEWGRCTQKPGKLYLHVFDWPKDGKLRVPIANKIRKAALLGGGRLRVASSGSGAEISVPPEMPDKVATVVVVEFAGKPHVITSGVAGATPPAPRPNIVLIISDDHGWTDYSFMGHPQIQTPRLDKLAAQSLTFRRGYVPSSLCCPSLAAIVTGLYPHQNKITCNDPPGPPLGKKRTPQQEVEFREGRKVMTQHMEAAPALPRLLAKQGYLSLQTGKWWQGDYRSAGFTHGMTRGERHGDDGLDIGRKTMQPVYDFIAAARKEGKPWLVWYAPFLPHTPHNPPEALFDKYKSKTDSPHVARYWAMVEWFDETCGQLLDHLDQQRLADNTIVLYVTDNGWIQSPDSPRPMRSKLTPYDAGLRTPIMIRWPGRVKPRMSDDLAMSIDLAPTVLVALGLKPVPAMQGVNLLDADAVRRRTAIFGECFVHTAVDLHNPSKNLEYRWVIDGHRKLILPHPSGDPELYDLAADPHEKNNLAGRHPDAIKALRRKLDAWWKPE